LLAKRVARLGHEGEYRSKHEEEQSSAGEV
jgi:hypothetical protein